MIFTRTSAGLSNLRLFKGVDLVVFSEGGGDTFSVQQAFSGRYHRRANDIEFWRPLFHRFKSEISVSFRAIGSKNTLKQIATELVHGTVSGVCVVMDKDFDELFQETIEHHRVLYTHKYSWESELFETPVMSRAFQAIAFSEIAQGTLENKIRPIVTQLRRELRHLVRADVVLFAAGKVLFRRNGGGSGLKNRRRLTPPSLNSGEIRARLASHHAAVKGFYLVRPLRRRIDIKKDCFGKLLLSAAVQTMHYLIEWQNQPQMRNEYCIRFLIHGFHAWLAERPGSGTARYYSRIIAAV